MKIKFERICKPYIHLHLVQSWTFCSYFKNTQFPLKVLLLTSALSIHDHKDVLFVNFRKVKLTHNPKFQSVYSSTLTSMNVRSTLSSQCTVSPPTIQDCRKKRHLWTSNYFSRKQLFWPWKLYFGIFFFFF